MAHALRSGGGGSGSGPAVVSPLLWLAIGGRDPGPRFDLAISPDKLGLSAALLSETNRQLDALGLIVKRGTLVDATLIAAAIKKPPYGSGGVNPRDPDARVTMKRKTAHFGYKAHLAVDEGSGLVRQAEMTSPMCMTFVWPKR
jgi:Transposase DDE domain